jgi:hypothetical protein
VRVAKVLEKTLLASGDGTVEHIDMLARVREVSQHLYYQAQISMVRRPRGWTGLIHERILASPAKEVRDGSTEYPTDDLDVREGAARSL